MSVKHHRNLFCEFCTSRVNSIFRTLPLSELEKMTQVKDVLHFKRKQPLFTEGSHPMGIYCISSGKIMVHKMGDEGRNQIIRFATEGNVVGYRELISEETYSLSATAMEDSVVCFMSRDFIYNIIRRNQETSQNLMRLMAYELREMEDRLTYTIQRTVKERLAASLLLIAQVFGVRADKSIGVTLSRKEISDIVGSSAETVIRILHDFQKSGYVDFSGREIKLLNKAGLKQAANLIA